MSQNYLLPPDIVARELCVMLGDVHGVCFTSFDIYKEEMLFRLDAGRHSIRFRLRDSDLEKPLDDLKQQDLKPMVDELLRTIAADPTPVEEIRKINEKRDSAKLPFGITRVELAG
jgi:hypothetical protein